MWRSWPHDYQPDGETPQETTESDFRFSLAAASQTGLDRTFGSALDATVAGSDLVLGVGRGVVNGYSFAADALESVPIPVNASSLPRLYRVVARLDVAANQIVPHVLEGTASSSPQPPALTRAETIYDLPVWRCRRNGGGGAISDLVDERTYINPSGALTCTSTSRPSDPLPGTVLYESDTGRLVYWHNGQWVTAADGAYPGSWQPLPLRTSRYTNHTNGFLPAWRWVRPGRVELRGAITRTVDSPVISGDYFAVLPAAARPGAFVRFPVAAERRDEGSTVRVEVRSTNAGPEEGQLTVWTSYGAHWFALDGIEFDI
ncbi:hypothetical protein [Nocardiopsis dassonvillei]|uniref:hypothetical protein n=1 Tax=Nocardiopsis dassonvillei TaxID=2014 RepID=UPI00362B64A6